MVSVATRTPWVPSKNYWVAIKLLSFCRSKTKPSNYERKLLVGPEHNIHWLHKCTSCSLVGHYGWKAVGNHAIWFFFFDSGLRRLELLVSLTPFISFYLFLFLVHQLFVKMMLDVMGKDDHDDDEDVSKGGMDIKLSISANNTRPCFNIFHETLAQTPQGKFPFTYLGWIFWNIIICFSLKYILTVIATSTGVHMMGQAPNCCS